MSYLGGALGKWPLGGFDHAGSLSVPDPLFRLLSDLQEPREFLLRASPLSGGTPTAVDLSGSGYVSRSTDSPFKHFQPALMRPGDFTVSLPVPSLHGAAQTGIGAALLSNPDALRDAEALLDWLGVDVSILLGPPGGALGDFTEILSGPGGSISRTLDDVTVLFRDAKFRLQRPLQSNKYRGFGASIRHDGVNDYTRSGAIGTTQTVTYECWFRCYGTTGGNQHIGQLFDAWSPTGVDFYIYIHPNGTINAVFHRGSGSISGTGSSVGYSYIDSLRHHVALVISDNGVTRTGKLYVDSSQVGSTVTPPAYTALANAKLDVGGIGGVGGYGKLEIDEVRLWSTARTIDQIIQYKDRELQGNESGLIHYWKCNEGSGGTTADSVGGGSSMTLNGSTWMGSLEGDAAIAGKPKPLAFGVRRQVAPVLVDPQNLVYQFHDGTMDAVTAMRDNCDPITFGSNLTDIYSAAPAAGTYNTSLANGLIRLGSAPVGTITGDIRGATGGTHGYENTVAGIARKILADWAGVSDSTGFDNAAWTALEALDASVVGHYWDAEVNIDAAIDEVFRSIWAWWAPNRTGQYTCGRVPNPATASATVYVNSEDLIEPTKGGRFKDDQMAVRVGEVRVYYRPYHTVFEIDRIAGVVAMASKLDFSQQYRVARAVNPDASDDADVLELHTSLDLQSAAQGLAETVLAVLEDDRRIVTLGLEGGLLSYFIGTVVNLTLARYNYGSGRNGVVVRLAEFYGDAKSSDRVEVDLLV